MLTLLLIGMLTLAFNIQPVKASGTIYIWADGSIDPPTAPIERDGDLYTLTGDITSDADGIAIERDNMTLDGAGYTVTGSGSGYGITLTGRSNVTVRNMTIKNFVGCGIYLRYYSNNNVLSGNNVTANNGYGIELYSSCNNTLSGNDIANYDWGICLFSSCNNTLSGNDIANNRWGICLCSYSTNNVFYHNNLINNMLGPVVSWPPSLANFWDDGYPSGGNYWSNYTGVDEFHGPNQDQDGSDGIGDTPHVIDTNNQDRYPFMNPWLLLHDVAIINVVLSKTIVGQGCCMFINVTAQNHGAFTETFNVIVYHDKLAVPTPDQQEIFWSMGDVNRDGYIDDIDANLIAAAFGSEPGDPNWNPDADLNQDSIVDLFDATICGSNYGRNIWTYFELSPPPIGKQTLALTSDTSTTITFLWNTIGVAKGNYTISAYAAPVRGETDTTDNTLTDGWVYVSVPGDITGPTPGVPDGIVNMRDIGYICNHFGTTPTSPNWNPNCDVTGPTKGVPDGIVNMRDIGEACNNFMKTDP